MSSNERDRSSGNGSLVVNVSEDIKNLTLHTHTNKDWKNMQPLDRTDSVNDVF
jgi:hypothetical protein